MGSRATALGPLELRGSEVGVPCMLLGCSGDLVRRLSNAPSGACYGLLGGLIGDTNLDLLSQLVIRAGGSG